jgi:predicted acylesterase/phospholipase RssA
VHAVWRWFGCFGIGGKPVAFGLCWHPLAQVIPLDWQSVLDSPLPLKVVASSLTTLRSEVLDNFDGRHDLVECLKATANVPEIVGPPRRHRGHDLVDAAVFEPLPVKAALKDGCTHVLALCSRPHSLGPAWGKYLSRTLHNAVKYWLLNPVSVLTLVSLAQGHRLPLIRLSACAALTAGAARIVCFS